MFATLVVTLPSAHTGGDLVVRHKGREVRLDVRCDEPSEAAFAAFYADCVHEVLPLTSGCRMVLVYNLLRPGKGRLPLPPNHESEQAGIESLLKRWSAGKARPDDATPEKLVYLLEHAYTPAELSFPTLKGADAAAAAVLTAAARASDCDLHVALLTIAEGGWAEHTGYPRSYRWGRDDDDDEDDDEFEIGEVLDCSRTLSDWGRTDGSPVALGPLPITDAEISPPDALADMEPDEQHFHEATGNEGASFERSYRRAALVLWPQARRLAVLSQAGLAVTLPYLDGLVARWAASGEARESPSWRDAHELAGHMLRNWGAAHRPRLDDTSDGARMLALMTRLQDTVCIEAILVDIIATGAHGQADNEAICTALRLLPVQRACEMAERIVTANAARCPGSCADLLARCAHVAALATSLAPAARALLAALPGDPARPAPAAFAWDRQPLAAGLVVDIASALPRIDATLASAAVAHLLAWPKTYGLDDVILPAVRQLSQDGAAATLAPVQALRAACLAHLQTRSALPLEAPGDWSRAPAQGCACRRCAELNRFLVDPDRRAWAFKAGEADRRHVHEAIRRGRCDLDCTTDKRGRPYSLVCTKNRASYDRRAAQRLQDLKDLALLQ